MKKLFYTILIGLFFLINTPLPTLAHPQPFVFQEFFFKFEKSKIDLTYKLHLDPIVVDEIFPIIDTDNTGTITDDESQKFVDNIVLPNLKTVINEKEIKFKVIDHKPLYKLDIISIENFIEVDFVYNSPEYLDINKFAVNYNKKFLADDAFGDLLFFEDNVRDNSDFIYIKPEVEAFKEGEFISTFKFAKDGEYIAPTVTNQSNTKSQEEVAKVTSGKSKGFFEDLREKSKNLATNFLGSNKTGLVFIIGGFIIAFIAGSLHAITPGHGKSMMAAFLIGKKKSNFSDILVLGSSITLAHTAIIFILGFVFLALDKKFSINNILPYFEKFSAILLLLLGISLIRNGYKNYKHNQKPHSHLDENVKIQSKKDLFVAGISGGVIPCTDAFSFLTYFVGIGKIAYGLAWVFFFSLGLAVAILIIGSVVIYGKVKLSNKSEQRFAKIGEVYAPAISGAIILILAINLIF
jgi:ABC-type nickel/cobalt efflux system permease component RcnA